MQLKNRPPWYGAELRQNPYHGGRFLKMSSSSRLGGGADQNFGSWGRGCPVQYSRGKLGQICIFCLQYVHTKFSNGLDLCYSSYCTIQKTLIRRFVSLYIGTYCTFVCATLFPGIQITALYSRKQNCTYKSMTDQKIWGSQIGDWM